MDAHSDCNKEYDKEPYQTNYAIGNEHAFPELSPDNHNERVDRNCLFNVVMPSQRVTNLWERNTHQRRQCDSGLAQLLDNTLGRAVTTGVNSAFIDPFNIKQSTKRLN